MRLFWKVGLAGVLAVIIFVGYGIVVRTGAVGTLETKLADQCHKVDVAPGAEDIQYDAETGLAFITADNRRVPFHSDGHGTSETLDRNGIYVVDVSPDRIEDIGNARKVSPDGLTGFRPHGLYFWRGDDSEKRLFVVNHRTTHGNIDEVIEIFAIGDEGALTHLESISFPEMTSPNDVVATGPRQFYVTNFLRHLEGNMAFAEIFLTLPYSSVAYFDGQEGRIVADGLSGANGINLSPDQTTLYASEWQKRQVAVFDRSANNNLKRRGKISIPAFLDNIDVDDSGNLWIAGQPKILEMVDYMEGKRSLVSSLGARVNGQTQKPETVFVSVNGELNTSSVMASAGDRLLIGSVFEDHILVCNKPD